MNFESTEEMVDGVVSSVLGGIGRNRGVGSANHTSGGVKFWDDPGFLNTRYLKENQTSSSMNPSQSQSLTQNQKLTQSQGLSLGLSNLSQSSLESQGQGYVLNQGQMMNQMSIMNPNQMNTNVSQMGLGQIQPLTPSQINLSQMSLKSYQPHNRSYSRNNSEPSIPSRMNINAPSYIPSYAKEEGGDDMYEKYQRLKVELIMKDQIIKNLTDQMSLATKSRSNERNELNSNSNQTMRVPQNHYELFEDLSQTLQEKTEELEDTKARLEAWVLGSNISGVTTPQGRLDPQELAHKMILKLKTLQEENEALLKMMSLSNKVSLMVEVGMLRQQKASE